MPEISITKSSNVFNAANYGGSVSDSEFDSLIEHLTTKITKLTNITDYEPEKLSSAIAHIIVQKHTENISDELAFKACAENLKNMNDDELRKEILSQVIRENVPDGPTYDH